MSHNLSLTRDTRIAVIGLGYIGLPLAAAFGRHRRVMGFDIDSERIRELKRGYDDTRELTPDELGQASLLEFTDQASDLGQCDVFIVSVPTPVTAAKVPDFGAVKAATRTIAACLSPGAVVIYESTVYPGATDEICVPLLEAETGLVANTDFFIGYSPERANPGDREHRLSNTNKLVAGSCDAVTEFLFSLYSEIITATVCRVSSIAVAEAAKVIENIQRDINIALVNELATIFSRLGIDTQEVLAAAGTKWNFLPFRPGLVGGHCIGVDPYYLTFKAQSAGLHPEMILAGRRINDGMGRHIASDVVRLMLRKRLAVSGARVLILGFAFKENCPDIRNTRVIDLVREFEAMEAQVDIHDPWINADGAYGFRPVIQPEKDTYQAVVLAVAHGVFIEMGASRIRDFCAEDGVLYDVKYALPSESVDGRL